MSNSAYEVFRSTQEIENNELGIYNEGLLPYTLLYQKEEEKGMSDKQFYGERIKSSNHQVNHLEALDKSVHNFVAIGIDPEDDSIEVKVKFTFPRLLNSSQYLFLSDDYRKLLEIHGEEACLYELVVMPSKHMKVVFKCRLPRLPFGICNNDVFQMYSLFSPDLTKHLDVNPNDYTWIVREADTGDVFFKVPPTFLTYNPKKPEQIMQQTRFMCWNTRR